MSNYQDDTATFNIEDGAMMSGKMPKRQTKLVNAGIEIHKDELIADWKFCQEGEKPFTINPLQ